MTKNNNRGESMFEIWNKKKVSQLTNKDIDLWFDVLNNGLVEDRGYQLNDSNIKRIKAEIKSDYVEYLKGCPKDDSFINYYVLRNDLGTILSICRVISKDSQYYLEGLETHRDYQEKGFASQLLTKVLHDLKRNNIKKIHSLVRNHNEKSINFHEKHGFLASEKDDLNTRYGLDVEEQLRKKLFDQWASTYNKFVKRSESEGTYPFAGYSEIKYQIIDLITKESQANVLDMGVGTGEITGPLYDLGYKITGVDLSENMIELANKKMPNASFIQGGFHSAINQLDHKYDYIIFNYSIHHLDNNNQINLLVKLHDYLKEQGIIIIGDVSSKNQMDMNKLKNKYERFWDDEEYYPNLDNFQKSHLKNMYHIDYKQINEVAGIYILSMVHE